MTVASSSPRFGPGLVLAVALAQVLLAPASDAQPAASAADESFKHGRELAKEGKFAEACAEFETSQALDPQLGTLFNIAQCSEKIGKLATAAAAYREVVSRDPNVTRRDTAADSLKGLLQRVPKLLVRIAAPPGLSITVDGKGATREFIANSPTEIDLGDYTVVAKARGYTEQITKIKITEEGKTTLIDVTLVPGARNADIVRKPPPPPPPPVPTGRRTFGKVLVVLGSGAAIAGGVFGLLAQREWKDARDVCGGTTCATQEELDRAALLGDRARSKATLSTASFIGAGVLAVTGIALWASAPSGVSVAPTATEHSAGVTFAGRF